MVSVNRALEQSRLHESWWWGNKSQPGAAACSQLAGLALHVAFGKWELIPAGKAEVDSLSWFAQANDCLPQLLSGNGSPQREDLVQASSWPLGGIRDTAKSAERLCYEFMVVDIFLQAAIPEEGKLIHHLHPEGRLEKALNKYELESCPNNDIWWQRILLLSEQNPLLNFNWNRCSPIHK